MLASLARLFQLQHYPVLFEAPFFERLMQVVDKYRECIRIHLSVRYNEELHAPCLMEGLEEGETRL